MRPNNTKNIFLFILVGLVAYSCESSDTNETDQDMHTDADGMEIVTMLDGEETEMYSECLGSVDNQFSSGVTAGTTWDFTVHFLDSDCEELEHDDEEGHDDHDHGDDDHDDHGDDHGDDEPYLLIEIADGGSTTIAISLEEHDDHEGEEHCEDFTTEADCGMHDECEWHADDMACEDAGHDDHDDHEEGHGYTFELETLAPGTTTFTVTLMHQGHSDYTSAPITIVVE